MIPGTEKMNAYPISRDFNKFPQVSGNNLIPIGDHIYAEVERRIIPHHHWGHAQKGAGDRTWRKG